MTSVSIEKGVLKALAIGISSVGELPEHVVDSASAVREANFSFNSITGESLTKLDSFSSLETLVLDNNEIESLKALPSLPKLKTLWLNNNSVDDLEELLGVLAKQCPQLEYLSLLRNPCCPNELTGKQETEYRRYRLYSKYRLPTLKMLDAAPFTDAEAKEAREKGKFLRAVAQKAVEPTPSSQAPTATSGKSALEDASFTGAGGQQEGTGNAAASTQEEEEDLFAKFDKKKEEREQAASTSGQAAGGPYFTQQRHFYSGKTSEGNRFIKDDVL